MARARNVGVKPYGVAAGVATVHGGFCPEGYQSSGVRVGECVSACLSYGRCVLRFLSTPPICIGRRRYPIKFLHVNYMCSVLLALTGGWC